jgi:hypothetical protein
MKIKLKKSTLFLFFTVSVIFFAFIIGHTWTFALETKSKDDLNKRIHVLYKLKALQKHTADILHTLDKALPDGVWITGLNVNKERLSLQGQALNNNRIAEYINHLKGEKIFNNIEFNRSTRIKKKGQNIFKFGLTILPGEIIGDVEKIKGQKQPDLRTILSRLENRLLEKIEIEKVLNEIQFMLIDSNLEIMGIAPTSTKSKKPYMYTGYTLIVGADGNYYNLNLFFDKVSKMDKMATIDELKIKPLSGTSKNRTLSATFKITMYIKN